MPNNKATGEPCYNIDVNASEYRLYAYAGRQGSCPGEHNDIMGGLYYAIPVVGDVKSGSSQCFCRITRQKIRSEIAWSKYMMPTDYKVNDDIELSKPSIKPGRPFTIGYVDSEHPEGTFSIYDEAGKQVFHCYRQDSGSEGRSLKQVGSYTEGERNCLRCRW